MDGWMDGLPKPCQSRAKVGAVSLWMLSRYVSQISVVDRYLLTYLGSLDIRYLKISDVVVVLGSCW